MSDLASRGMQDYLKAIHRLGGVEQVVSPVELAVQLEVRAPSVTSMLKRLAEGGWVQYEPGRGARLTATGTAEARRVIRRHRLMELFLTRVLGLDWSDVDAEAEALEHAISPAWSRPSRTTWAIRRKTPTAIPSPLVRANWRAASCSRCTRFRRVSEW